MANDKDTKKVSQNTNVLPSVGQIGPVNILDIVDPQDGAIVRPIDGALLREIKASMAEHGQADEIHVYVIPDGDNAGKLGIIEGRHRVEAGKELEWSTIRAKMHEAPATPADRLLKAAAFNVKGPMKADQRTRCCVRYYYLLGKAGTKATQKNIGQVIGVAQPTVSLAKTAFDKATDALTKAYLEGKCTFEQYFNAAKKPREDQRALVKAESWRDVTDSQPQRGKLGKKDAENFTDIVTRLVGGDVGRYMALWLVDGDTEALKHLILLSEKAAEKAGTKAA